MNKFKNIGICLLSLFLLCAQWGPARDIQQEKAVKGLIERLLPSHSSSFEVWHVEKSEKDYFEIESVGDKIILRGTSGVAIASALNYYLREYGKCQIDWHSRNINLPGELPRVEKKVVKETPYIYRYYFNYCTFNYSMSWWDWERWEREIDFMHLTELICRWHLLDRISFGIGCIKDWDSQKKTFRLFLVVLLISIGSGWVTLTVGADLCRGVGWRAMKNCRKRYWNASALSE